MTPGGAWTLSTKPDTTQARTTLPRTGPTVPWGQRSVSRLRPGLPYVGRVDAKTADAGLVWVVSLEGSGRQMIGNRDGVIYS